MNKIDEIISSMNLEDKIALCSGGTFWETKKFEKYGIPSIFMCDGPHGLRKQENKADMLGINKSMEATCFPSEVTTANSFDEKLLQEIGDAIGQEAKGQDVAIVLGPGANIKRNPLCGRNFEYFSEDPYLSGKLAASFIRGIENNGVSSCVKHFAVNSQEYSRFNSNSVIDSRTLNEIYLRAFEIAVKEGNPSTVMCAYPKLNGVHCSDNKELLTDILRKKWGFKGAVVTDWGGLNDRIEGFKAGCDLSMPGGSNYMEKDVYKAIKEGKLDEAYVNDSVRRILELVFRVNDNLKHRFTCDYNKHNILAMEAACKGAVLLKNNDDLLPLEKDAKIAIIGNMAKNMRYQGSGSSHINPTKLTSPLDCFKDVLYSDGYDENGDTNKKLLNEASELSKKVDAVLLFVGLPERYESEGFDRENMKLPEGQLTLIDEVCRSNKNVVIILFSGSVVECPFADKVKSILYMGLPGQAGGQAVYDLIYGKFNPCGKLAQTWPIVYEDDVTSDIYGKTKDGLYMEGIYVGYRYYDKANIKVRWPFGYGLSYTNYKYSDLQIKEDTVSVKVTNIGKRSGEETVLMYIKNPQDSIHRPIKELRAFKKIHLNPDETKVALFKLEDRDFSIYDNGFKVIEGIYEICVGDLSQTIHKDGETINIPSWQINSFYENCKGKPNQKEWEKMLGFKYERQIPKKGCFTMDNTVLEMKDDSLLMKIMFKSIESTIAKGFGGKKDYNDPNFKMLMNSSAGSPLRSMQISGGIKGGLMQGMLEIVNGHFFKGIKKMIEK